jgi:hypothetical protein
MKRKWILLTIVIVGWALISLGFIETGDFLKPKWWPFSYVAGFGYSLFDVGLGILFGYVLIEILYLSERRKIARLGEELVRQEVAVIGADLKLISWNTTTPIVINYPVGTSQAEIDRLYRDAELNQMDSLSKDKKQLANKLDPNLLSGKLPNLFSIHARKLRTLQITYATYFDADFLVPLVDLAEYLDRLELHVELVVKERARPSGISLSSMYEDEVYNDLQKLLSTLVSATRNKIY